MEQYEQQGGQGVPPQQFYQNMPVRPVANSMTILALIFAIIAALTILTGIIPIFFGSLAILFAVLSKGSNLKMDSSGKISTAIATVSMILGITITGVTMYEMTYDPEMKSMMNDTFEQMYGVSFDEYMEQMQQFYENPDQPPEFLNNLPQRGKVDTL